MKKKLPIRTIGQNRGTARIWLEQKILSESGWRRGDAFNPVFEPGRVTYRKSEDGTRKVQGTAERPVIDTNSAKIIESLGDIGTKCTVHATATRIVIQPLES